MNHELDFGHRKLECCTIAEQDNTAFMEALPDESMDLILTSPPYNIGKAYEKHNRQSMDGYIQGQESVIKEAIRLLKPTGSICWQVGNHIHKGEPYPLDAILYPVFKRHGLFLRNRIVWFYRSGLNCGKRLSGRHETILWFAKSLDHTFNLDEIRVPQRNPQNRYSKGPRKGELTANPLGMNPGDVWDIPTVKGGHPEKTEHPCQFPVELAERLVLSLTNKGESVFDPYMGSGSTLIAALKHGRKAWGCDTSPEYVAIARERVRKLREGTLKTLSMDRHRKGA